MMMSSSGLHATGDLIDGPSRRVFCAWMLATNLIQSILPALKTSFQWEPSGETFTPLRYLQENPTIYTRTWVIFRWSGMVLSADKHFPMTHLVGWIPLWNTDNFHAFPWLPVIFHHFVRFSMVFFRCHPRPRKLSTLEPVEPVEPTETTAKRLSMSASDAMKLPEGWHHVEGIEHEEAPAAGWHVLRCVQNVVDVGL